MNDQRFRLFLESRFGWDALYRPHIHDLSQPTGRGECRARCPLPDHNDDRPSFSVNVHTGAWNCRGCQRQGNYVHFRAYLEPREFDPAGDAVPDFNAAERALKIETGFLNPVNPEWLQACRDALANNAQLRHHLERLRPWNVETLLRYRIGWDDDTRRLVFPVIEGGRVVNCHLYALNPPAGQPKYLWHLHGLGGSFLWPKMPNTDWVVLTEGEGDVLSLLNLKVQAICSTGGAADFVPPGDWMVGKRVFILGDTDDAGVKAARDAGFILRERAEAVFICRLPMWPDRPEKADVTDYLLHLREQGASEEEQQAALRTLRETAEQVPPADPVFDAPVVPVRYSALLNPDHAGRPVVWEARVTARLSGRFELPLSWEANCPRTGYRGCPHCPMRQQWRGHHVHQYDPRQRDSVRVVRASDDDVARMQKETMGVPAGCNLIRIQRLATATLEPVTLMATMRESAAVEGEKERQRREALVLMRGQAPLVEGAEYAFRGYVHPDKRQQLIALVDEWEPITSLAQKFTGSPEMVAALKEAFCVPDGSAPRAKLDAITQDISDHRTGIHGRLDLHHLFLSVFFSALSFPLFGRMVERGWMDALVVGDTRTGKSETYRRLSEFLGIGVHVDCKLSTVPGMTGTAIKSEMTGEWFVEPGLWPRSDGQIVCMDEFAEGKGHLIETMSQTRATGMVTVAKAGGASFPARVRSIWLANPAEGKDVGSIGVLGVQLIPTVVRKPEDIARFTAATIVAREEVPLEVLYTRPEGEPLYSADLLQTLLAWLWSRRPDQIRFTEAAEEAIKRIAAAHVARYSPAVPLVEPSEQRQRIAKVALSIAARLFSTDEDAEVLIVREPHVRAADSLFRLWYDKPAMGYHLLGDWHEKNTEVTDVEAALEVLNSLGKDAKDIARRMLYAYRVHSSQLKDMLNCEAGVDARRTAERLGRLNVWAYEEGGTVVLTPGGMKLLTFFLNGSGPGPHPEESTRIDFGGVDWAAAENTGAEEK